MLFGPRKAGFAKEVVIPEFEDEVREEKQTKVSPPKIIVREQGSEPEPPNLLDYLDIPEEEEMEHTADSESQAPSQEKTKAQLLADFIRARSIGAKLTGKRQLAEEEEDLAELLEALKEDESCSDIVSVKGDKDEYFYSNQHMSYNYAMIAVLVEEKDLPKTIAQMVRWNAKTYPMPTPVYYFSNSPYYYTEPQIERALHIMKQKEEYQDIGEVITGNGVKYLFSTLHMSEKYAKALAEDNEQGEFGY